MAHVVAINLPGDAGTGRRNAARLPHAALASIAGIFGAGIVGPSSRSSDRPAMSEPAPNEPAARRKPVPDHVQGPVTGQVGASAGEDPGQRTAAEPADRLDERLLVASRNGDRNAFRTLMERHREDLLRFLVRFLGSRTAADDVFQETFLQVHLAADTFDAERRFRPWLFAIAANKARDFHRRSKRRATASLSSPVGVGEASLVDLMAADMPSPEAPAASGEVAQAVKRVVDEMPSHYREILLLSYFQRMSYQQVAECLGIPLGTVKSRLHAAVAHFSSAWKATREGQEDERF